MRCGERSRCTGSGDHATGFVLDRLERDAPQVSRVAGRSRRRDAPSIASLPRHFVGQAPVQADHVRMADGQEALHSQKESGGVSRGIGVDRPRQPPPFPDRRPRHRAAVAPDFGQRPPRARRRIHRMPPGSASLPAIRRYRHEPHRKAERHERPGFVVERVQAVVPDHEPDVAGRAAPAADPARGRRPRRADTRPAVPPRARGRRSPSLRRRTRSSRGSRRAAGTRRGAGDARTR